MLKSSLEMDKDNVSMRFKSEIKDIQKKTSIKIQNLMSEFQNSQNELQEKQFLQIKEEYITGLTVLSEELSNSRREIAQLKKDINAKNTEIENYKADLDSTNRELEISKRTSSELANTNDELKEKLNSIEVEKKKIRMRFKSEIKDIQKKDSIKIQSLMSEIQKLQKEIGEKQYLFERANREKQALESKMEHMFSENSNGLPVSNSAFDDMCKRLTSAERTRDEFELKVSFLDTALKKTKSAKEQEIQYLLEIQNSLNERLQKISNDFNQVSSDRIKSAHEMTKLRKRLFDLKKELANLKLKFQKDISTLEADSRHKIHSVQKLLLLTEEYYKNLCSELQTLLETEFKISNKLKSEVDYLISKSEFMLKEMSQEIVLLKNKNFELINTLHQNSIRIPNEF